MVTWKKDSSIDEMKKAFTVELKTIVLRHADKGELRDGERVKYMTKYMTVEKNLAKRHKKATISMPRVLLDPLEKRVDIPDDVIPEILVKLPTRSVGRFRSVCYSICVPPNSGRLFLGFYFHHSTSKYRIIEGVENSNNLVVKTAILVVGEKSWRFLPFRFTYSYYEKSIGLNGCLFWLAFTNRRRRRILPIAIMTFDTESEVYDLLSLPPSEKVLEIACKLVDFNGELGLCIADNDIIDVWIMEECWVKRYSINLFDLTECSVRYGGVVVFVKDKELLIDHHTSEERFVIRCNLKSGTWCCHQREFHSKSINLSLPYMETLAYPHCF